MIVGKIGIAQVDLALLSNEAAAFLNEFTHIEYCVLVKIWPSLPRFQMRILVCQRLKRQVFQSAEKKEKKIKELKGKAKAKKKFCRKKLELDNKKAKFIEKNYPVRVIFDQTVTDASQDVVFYLETLGLTIGTGLALEQPTLRIAIPSASIAAIMAMFNEMVNS